MGLDVNKELKIYWILGLIVAFIYGFWFFIFPGSYHALTGGGPYFSPVTLSILGGIYLAWGVIILILYKELDNWEKIESWMLFAVIEESLSAIAQIIAIIVYNLSITSYIIGIIINILFALVGIHIILQKKK